MIVRYTRERHVRECVYNNEVYTRETHARVCVGKREICKNICMYIREVGFRV